ncbi:hypothetical protein BT93_G1835 [Corymbia citriodora subsp. variegata]|nr:hypothetical protein BT93_G1835 [Corymbia citriodora subsp. variegata]
MGLSFFVFSGTPHLTKPKATITNNCIPNPSLTRILSPIQTILWYFIVIVNGVIPLFSSCTSTAELITELPGHPDGVFFTQHSGCIVMDTRHGHALFYYFVEADARNLLSYPLTLWFAGVPLPIRYYLCYCLPFLIDFGLGPGCSFRGFGAFMEHGPFRPAWDSSLMKNEFSWNKVLNMLYVEFPIGVGFSYSNTTLDYINWGDADTVWQFSSYDFRAYYLTKNVSFSVSMQLGNPLLDLHISVDAANFLWSHGIISDKTLKLKKMLCNDSRSGMEESITSFKECAEVLAMQTEELGNFTIQVTTFAVQSALIRAWDAYNAKVRHGHVWPNSNMFGFMTTFSCRNFYGFCVVETCHEVMNITIPVALCISTDDVIMGCTMQRRSRFANTIDPDEDDRQRLKFTSFGGYAPWYDKMQVGGWTQSFGRSRKGKNATRLAFATVRGAAHEVPYASPSQALTLFKPFLKGSSLPKVPFKN